MQIKLKIAERVSLTNLLNEFKGNITGLYKIIKMMDQLEIPDKERKDIELKLTPNQQGGVSFDWNVEKDKGKSIEFDDLQTGYIKQLITAKNSRDEITMGDKLLLGIIEKLGIKDEFNLQKPEGGKEPKSVLPSKV